jgi:hypothetical protein
MKIKIAVIAIMGMSLGVNAQTEYPIIQPNIKVNNSPWYGLGRSNVIFPNGNYEAVQLAGYYGLLFKTSGGEFVLHQNGNVGIGTSNPSEKLCLEGDDSTKLKIQNNSSTKDLGIWLRGKRSGSNVYSSHYIGTEGKSHYNLKINADERLKLQTNGQDRLTILSNGKIGIGTTSTGNHRLAVEGSIGAREIKVEANGWSDFVFYDNYNLPTLKEVESHIKEKGHLKDIPSAKEVEENGILLGEMNSKLLQKIEELTLYTIQQDKRLNSIEFKNLKLEKENESLKTINSKLLQLQKRLEKLEKK